MGPQMVHVLLVEDNAGDARLVQEMLNDGSGTGFPIERAASAHDAVEILASGKHRPEVILLDLGLPDEQGLQTLRRISPAADGLPLVVLTGLRDDEIADAAVREGAQDYLYKEQLDGDRLRRVIRHAIERHRFQSQIRSALQEKEALLREVYHRVKNNLQVVQSLLKIQARSVEDEQSRHALADMAQRVYSMALVHERLYRNDDLGALSVEDYIGQLFEGALATYSVNAGQIHLQLEVEDIPLSFEHAVPFGLLLNELLCNALKHAFPDGRKGTISFAVHRSGSDVCFTLKDDGVGLPAGFRASSCSSMGLKVAIGLAHQLGGEVVFSSENGCVVRGTFKGL